MSRKRWACVLAMWLFLIGESTYATKFNHVLYVHDCPEGDLEQSFRLECKNTMNTSFKLHCIHTDDLSKKVLVCKEWIWIPNGMCPVYSIRQDRIYPKCIEDDTQCPNNVTHNGYYKSFESNKYPACNVNLKTTTTKAPEATTETTPETTTETTNTQSCDKPTYALALIVVLFIISFIVNFILIVCFREPILKKLKRWKEHCCGNTNHTGDPTSKIPMIPQSRDNKSSDRDLSLSPRIDRHITDQRENDVAEIVQPRDNSADVDEEGPGDSYDFRRQWTTTA